MLNVTHIAIGIAPDVFADKVGKEKVLIIGYSVFATSTIGMLLLSEEPLHAYIILATISDCIRASPKLCKGVLYQGMLPLN